MNTGMDDQLARCKVAEEEGWGLVHNHSEEISSSVDSLWEILPPKFEEEQQNGSKQLAIVLAG